MSVDYTLVRTHRAVGRWLRFGRGLAAVLLVLATLLIARVITVYTPDPTAQHRPFIRTGRVGSVVDARTFDVTVLGVRGAATISDGTSTHDTGGVWIIVDVRLTATTNPLLIGYAALLDGEGRTYRSSARIDQPLVSGRELQPGVPVTGELAFEVPVAVATDLAIELSGNELDRRMDAIAQVHLPIDGTQIGQWRAATQPAVLVPAKAAA